MENLIEKLDKKYKECILFMLPTERAENCLLSSVVKDKIFFEKGYFTQEYLKEIGKKSYHLYVTSDDEIKKDDWMYCKSDKKPIQWNGDLSYTNNPATYGYKKVIATTDKNLSINNFDDVDRLEDIEIFLPQMPQSFIEHYIDNYNKGNIISELLVEYDEIYVPLNESNLIDGVTKVYWLHNTVCTEYTYYKNGEVGYMIEKGRSIEYSTKEYRLKINQNDNTIIIKNKQENVYTESEVIALCKKAYSRGHYNSCFKNGAEPTLSNEWINENLK